MRGLLSLGKAVGFPHRAKEGVCVRETLQPDWELDITRSDNILDFEVLQSPLSLISSQARFPPSREFGT